MCRFTAASNRFFKQGEETQKEVSSIDVSCWTRLAEVCGEYLRKVRGVRVVAGSGRIAGPTRTAEMGSRVPPVQEEAELKEAAGF